MPVNHNAGIGNKWPVYAIVYSADSIPYPSYSHDMNNQNMEWRPFFSIYTYGMFGLVMYGSWSSVCQVIIFSTQ